MSLAHLALSFPTVGSSDFAQIASTVDGNPDRARGFTATVGLVNDTTHGCIPTECSPDSNLCSDGTTPCGYSQIFSRIVQPSGL